MQETKTIKEPLFHISKRDGISTKEGIIIRAIAIASAIFLSIILTWIFVGKNPLLFFKALFSGSFSSGNIFWNFLKSIAILLCISVAVAPAFKMKFWNIGADGQALMGAVGAYICKRIFQKSLPDPVLTIVCLIVAVLFGIIWGIIPAFFKAKWNTNETLFTLMMNYIAIQIVLYLKTIWAKGTALPDIKAGNLEQIYQYLTTILIVAIVTAIMYIYLKYSKHGFEIAIVGESENTARYVGININKTILRTMALSGAICGLTGYLIICGQDRAIGLTENIIGGIGFTAIIVAWLAKFNPIYMILTSAFVVFFEKGATNIYPTNDSFGKIIVGIIFLFIIGCEFFINYSLKFRKKPKDKKLVKEGK